MAKHALVPEQKLARFRFAALRSPNFTALWLGGIISYIGTQMQLVGTAWLVLQSADSALLLGLLGLFSAVPMLVLPLFGGLLADRVNRITLLKWARSLQIVLPVLTASLLATGHLQLWMLYVHTFLVAVATAFSLPANQALLPSLVPEEDALSANALQSAIFASSILVGPALGGLLLQPLGVAGLYLVDALSTLAVFIPLFLLPGISELERQKVRIPRQSLPAEVRALFVHRSLPPLLGLAICLSLLQGSYQTLLPVFAHSLLHMGADGYGWLRSASGAGALISSFLLAAVGNIRRKSLFAVGLQLIQACTLVLFALVPFLFPALGLIFLVGISGTMASAFVQTQLYLHAPPQARNSVMALYVVALVGCNAFGGMLSGSLAQFFGVAPALIWMAVGGMALTLLLKRALTRWEQDTLSDDKEKVEVRS